MGWSRHAMPHVARALCAWLLLAPQAPRITPHTWNNPTSQRLTLRVRSAGGPSGREELAPVRAERSEAGAAAPPPPDTPGALWARVACPRCGWTEAWSTGVGAGAGVPRARDVLDVAPKTSPPAGRWTFRAPRLHV